MCTTNDYTLSAYALVRSAGCTDRLIKFPGLTR
jgi:hypothetical protein